MDAFAGESQANGKYLHDSLINNKASANKEKAPWPNYLSST